MSDKSPSASDKIRQCAVDLHDMCRDRLEAGMPADDVALALVRVVAHFVVSHDLGGETALKALSGALAIARAKKNHRDKVEAGSV
jgi:hypothetical protein